MLGAIIGDIIGSRFEFKSSQPNIDFELFTDECDFTDDTICTVAIADAILNNRSYEEAIRDWCHRYRHPMGDYGGLFNLWLDQQTTGPNNSCGNGAAMRVSPIGWLFHDYPTIVEESKKSCVISHCHSEAIKGAKCVSSLIYWLRTCRITKEQIENVTKNSFGYTLPPIEDINKIGSEGHFDSVCQETVPWAIRCFLESQSFESAIRIAVRAGGDTDTKAAICGSIAEAFYQIPDQLIERAYDYLPDDILSVVEQFYEKLKTDMVGSMN